MGKYAAFTNKRTQSRVFPNTLHHTRSVGQQGDKYMQREWPEGLRTARARGHECLSWASGKGTKTI